ncbi:four helix bundle protein [Thiomicrospira sp.]|uniref:four helix bundle protein n=1 Tax=Thiomicrospira sp. TaxID=935 RepID=UPI002F92A8A1
MKTENLVLDKSFTFSIRIVKVYQFLSKEHKEYALSKQLLRAGTSIGANINEAQAAQSEKDFIGKLSIANKEARETHYWLQLLTEMGYLNNKEQHVVSLLEESIELIKLLTSIIKTTQLKNKK